MLFVDLTGKEFGGLFTKGRNIMRKFTLEYIEKEALKLGKWKIIDTVYKGATTKLKCECSKCGVCNTMTWSNIKQNKGCRNCNKLVYVPKRSTQEVRKSFEKEGYVLLSKRFTGSKQKLKYRCEKNHEHSITWSNWDSNKRRCPYCVKEIQAERFKKDFDIIKKSFEKEGYELLTKTYENNQQKLEYICSSPKKHRHSITWHHWNQGQRCPDCVPRRISKFEEEVKKYVKNKNISLISNDRTQLVNPETGYNLELDIWFPNLNKAIECHGIYWHSKERMVKTDKIKQQLCKKQGINLLVITDKEWASAQKKCRVDILSFLEGSC